MLVVFEKWLGAHGRPGATAARLAFVDAWNTYYTLFESWKSKDCEQLVDNLIAYYIELSALHQTVMEKSHKDESVDEQLKTQLNEVKSKIEKLGGSLALEKLQTAPNAHRQQENKPRTPSPPPTENESPVDKNDINQLLNGYGNSELTNQQLAHELILDPDFKLEKYTPQNNLEKQIRSIAERAFFDKLAEDIEQGTSNAPLLSIIKDIKTVSNHYIQHIYLQIL